MAAASIMKLTRPPSGVDEAWVLDWHFAPPGSPAVDGDGRTAAGQLLFEAKYRGDGDSAEQLRIRMCLAMRCLPASSFARIADHVVTMPQNDENRLALSALVAATAEPLRTSTRRDALAWRRPVPKMKDVDPDDRPLIIASALVTTAPLVGTIVIVDDLIDTGATMSEAARALREAGATAVVGIAATQIRR